METPSRGLNWKTIITSSLLILVLSMVINTLITTVYGFVVGFQTRGDTDAITQRLAQFTASPLFSGLCALSLAALVFWRGKAVARAAGARYPLHIMLIIAINLVLGFVMGRFVGGFPADALIAQSAVQLAAAATAAFVVHKSAPAQVTSAA